MELTERKKKVLRAIVEIYIETAEPVGSKAVAEKIQEKVSTATIRNEMADLESMGYLEKPHTSAGRVPSPKGYRLYVNELMQRQKVSAEETEQINQLLKGKMEELDKVIGQAGRLVSQMTNYPTFAITTAAKKPTVSKFDCIYVDGKSFIAVIMTDTKAVRNKLIRVPGTVDADSLDKLNKVLNTFYAGKNRDELSEDVTEGLADRLRGLASLVLSFAAEVLDNMESRDIFTTGENRLLAQPEYQDVKKAQKLMSYINDSDGLNELQIPKEDKNGTRILIGPENVAEELKDTSVIVASYDIGEGMRGVVGVVGPTRMDYAKVAAKLSCVADNISQIFSGRPEKGDALPTGPAGGTKASLKAAPEKKKLPAGRKDAHPKK